MSTKAGQLHLNDYRTALIRWIQVREVDGIVFCEGSGADLSDLQAIASAAQSQRQQVEFLSFNGQDFDPSLGRGYGEMRIIRHAVEHSELIARAKLIIKITGRLFIPNFASIAKDAARSGDIDLICDLHSNLTSADSRVFCATRTFLQEYLLPYGEIVNDSNGIYFENALARAAHRAMADGRRFSLPTRAPRVNGVDASKNQRISAGMVKQGMRQLLLSIKAFVLKR